jgi:methylmalonyl-CoA mutase N-terminal domain/subunit
MPHIIEAARVRATEGEMVTALQEVFGTYSELPVF